MPITDYKLTEFAKIIANLGDKPNNTEFTAQSIKEYFDSSPEELRLKLNALIDAIVKEYATKTELQNVTLGQIADNSIDDAKLSTASGNILSRFLSHIADNLSQQTVNEILMNFNPVFVDNFDSDSRSRYTLSGCTLTAPSGGITRFNSTTTDPMVTLPASFSGGINRYIIFRYKVITGTPSSGQILYTTGSHSISASYSKVIPALIADNQWHITLLDMYSLDAGGTDWKSNTITSVRFDFTESSGVDVDFDYLSIGSIGYAPKQAGDISIVDTNNHFTSVNVEDALNELFTSASDGKTGIASAVTAKGVSASSSDTFSTLATKIGQIPKGQGNAVESLVLSGTTFSNADGVLRTGTMPNKSGNTTNLSTLNDGTGAKQSYISAITDGGTDLSMSLDIFPPQGYYDGSTAKLSTRFWGVAPENVAAGQKIGWNDGTALVGTYTSDANAAAGDIASGKTAFVNGIKVTGNVNDYRYTGQDLASSGIAAVWDGSISFHVPNTQIINNAGWLNIGIDNMIATYIKAGVQVGNIAGGHYITGTYSQSPINTVVRGSRTIQSSESSVTLALGGFDFNKSVVMINWRGGTDACEIPMAEIFSNGNLQLSVFSNRGNYIDVEYQILEFSNVKSIQRGTSSLENDMYANPVNVTISPVNTSKSLLFFTYKSSITGTQYVFFVKGQITSSTNIQFKWGAVYPMTINWNVVEFN